MNTNNINEEKYEELIRKIYEGIYFAHPNIREELADEYARIALYMIRKNKIKMDIHAPKKSKRRFQKMLIELQKAKELQDSNRDSNIIQIEELRRKYTKKDSSNIKFDISFNI